MGKDPFDFTDLSDLPDDLAKKLHTETSDNARVFADVVDKGAAAGHTELDINQIMAAAIRLGMDVPTQATVRGYLNKAVDMGLIQKPSRQTYGALTATKVKRTKAEDAGLAPEATTTSNDDPLADL